MAAGSYFLGNPLLCLEEAVIDGCAGPDWLRKLPQSGVFEVENVETAERAHLALKDTSMAGGLAVLSSNKGDHFDNKTRLFAAVPEIAWCCDMRAAVSNEPNLGKVIETHGAWTFRCHGEETIELLWGLGNELTIDLRARLDTASERGTSEGNPVAQANNEKAPSQPQVLPGGSHSTGSSPGDTADEDLRAHGTSDLDDKPGEGEHVSDRAHGMEAAGHEEAPEHLDAAHDDTKAPVVPRAKRSARAPRKAKSAANTRILGVKKTQPAQKRAAKKPAAKPKRGRPPKAKEASPEGAAPRSTGKRGAAAPAKASRKTAKASTAKVKPAAAAAEPSGAKKKKDTPGGLAAKRSKPASKTKRVTVEKKSAALKTRGGVTKPAPAKKAAAKSAPAAKGRAKKPAAKATRKSGRGHA
ncbi:unnamed protein product [Pedinophyceae sp. YPF-701]|nr:unnamed protein product [Pedinophyceae sp. YPF-701]